MINLGLSRITALVAQSPTYQTWKAVHIAGTNGKGSVAAYLSSLFLRLSRPSDSHEELKIGRFTSPHLIDRWDCITINDKPVSESLFLTVEQEVKKHAEKVAKGPKKDQAQGGDGGETVTEFELLTATAFEIFSRQKCQVAIIECGLGGRLDATNVLKPQDVACSVITKIGWDHMGVLGNSLEAIAREKAGIIKKRVPLVIDATNKYNVIEAIAIIANSINVTPTLSRQPEVEDQWSINRDKAIGRMPPHQYNNLVLALSAFTTSQDNLPSLTFTDPTPTVLPQILTDMRTSYPARLQHLDISTLCPNYTNPILLDGAHNPQSAEVLKTYLDSLAPNPTKSKGTNNSSFMARFFKPPPIDPKPRIWILAMSRGKDTQRILQTLIEPHDTVICCHFSRVDGMPWITPTSPSALAGSARYFAEREKGGQVREASDVVEALQIATRQCLERRGHEAGHETTTPAPTTTMTTKTLKERSSIESGRTTASNASGNSALSGTTAGSTSNGIILPPSSSSSSAAAPDNSNSSTDIEIVVAGSLYLASDLLRAIRDGPGAVRARFGVVDGDGRDIGVAI